MYLNSTINFNLEERIEKAQARLIECLSSNSFDSIASVVDEYKRINDEIPIKERDKPTFIYLFQNETDESRLLLRSIFYLEGQCRTN